MTNQKLGSKNSTREHLLRQSNLQQHDPFNPIAISYDSLRITATIKKTKAIKDILYDQKGSLDSGTFTAILGPSGSGKTTLLNFLSGRLVSDNLSIKGNYYLNGNVIESVEPYASQIAYIMQDDVLLEEMTPRESFMFAANLRLTFPKNKKVRRVNALIEKLGLDDCCDTKIGSNTKKGISGGQRKRTSIGVDLITNPSMIFLDQPTTGLDSTTALQVVLLLRKLANQGRTVVSTIHQPSSQVFAEFDRLMLLVQGRNIFLGRSKQAQVYFNSLGYTCPLQMNHSQFYMDLMSFQYKQVDRQQDTTQNYDSQKQIYSQKMAEFESKYKQSEFYSKTGIKNAQKLAIQKETQEYSIGFFSQFWYIFRRCILNEVRAPLSLALRSFQSVFSALVVLLIFGRINTTDIDDLSDTGVIQTARGIVFFLVSFCVMTGIQATLSTFSGEKPVFLRQRFSKTYSTFPYFWGRSLATFPFEVVYASIPCTVIFWGCGMNNNSPENFLQLLLISNALYFTAVSYGLFYSTVIPKLETAMALVPALIIPFMMLSGFFISLDRVPKIFLPLEYLSPFRYGFQGMMLNEFHNKQYESQLDFTPNTVYMNVIALLGISLGLRVLSLVAMYMVSSPKRPRINQGIVVIEQRTTGQIVKQ